MPRPVWKEGVGRVEPKRHCQIQESLPIVRGRIVVVEVMPAHCASKGLPNVAKFNIEIT